MTNPLTVSDFASEIRTNRRAYMSNPITHALVDLLAFLGSESAEDAWEMYTHVDRRYQTEMDARKDLIRELCFTSPFLAALTRTADLGPLGG